MIARHRLTIAMLVLLIAATIALWPDADDTTPDTTAQDTSRSTSQRQPPDLTEARAEAALRRCPDPTPGSSGSGPLAGVSATCLGDGTTIDVGSALAGRTALLYFWSPDDDTCRRDLAVLDEYATSAGSVPVIGVQVQGDAIDGLQLLTDLSVRLPTVRDEDGAIHKALRPPANRSASYVVTPDGNVHSITPDAPFTSPEQVQTVIDRHVNPGS